MSDRTSATLIVHDVPADQVQAVIDVITEYDLIDVGEPDPDRIELGSAWQSHSIRCGSADEIADSLRASAPSASWTVYEDPAYEWLGDVRKYVSGIGEWSAQCDSEGTPVFPAHAIRLAVQKGTVAALLGDEWITAIAQLTANEAGAVIVAAPESVDA